MNRRTFMSLGALLAAPMSLLKGKEPEYVEPQYIKIEPCKYCGKTESHCHHEIAEEMELKLRGYVIVEDSGTFGNLTNGYHFKLAVRECHEPRYSWLEGCFLCEPPKVYTEEMRDMFPIESPSIKCCLRLLPDGVFKSNGPYVVSPKLAEALGHPGYLDDVARQGAKLKEPRSEA